MSSTKSELNQRIINKFRTLSIDEKLALLNEHLLESKSLNNLISTLLVTNNKLNSCEAIAIRQLLNRELKLLVRAGSLKVIKA